MPRVLLAAYTLGGSSRRLLALWAPGRAARPQRFLSLLFLFFYFAPMKIVNFTGSEPSLRLVWAQNQPNFRPNRQNAGNFAENVYLLLNKLFRGTPLPPPSTCSAAEPTHPTAAQGHNELAYKCWYAQLDAYSNAAPVILAGERRRHSVDSRIAMRRTACPDARLGALLWCRRKASGRAAQARPSG